MIKLEVILCRFHVAKTYKKKEKKLEEKDRGVALYYFRKLERSKSKEEIQTNLDELRKWTEISDARGRFWKWVEKYTNGSWLEAHTDFKRENCLGLFNTNNFSEARIRWLIITNQNGKRLSVPNVLLRIKDKMVEFELIVSRLMRYVGKLIYLF